MTDSGHPGRIRVTGVTEHPLEDALLWLNVGRPDHLAPLLSIVGDKLTEVAGRARKDAAAEVGKPRLDIGIGKASIDLLVEFLDDRGRRALRCADALPA